jgi:type IV pilus assembly protein PilW
MIMKENNQLGFSMIELMVAMVISSILMAAVYSFFITSSKMSLVQETAVAAVQSVRAGLELMVQDIQMAGYDPLGNSGASIAVSQIDKIQVTSDRNGSGTIDDTYEKLTYELSAGKLKRTLYSTKSEYLISNVTALTFTYPSSNRVNIELEVTETVGGGGETIVRNLETTVYCRNLDL